MIQIIYLVLPKVRLQIFSRILNIILISVVVLSPLALANNSNNLADIKRQINHQQQKINQQLKSKQNLQSEIQEIKQKIKQNQRELKEIQSKLNLNLKQSQKLKEKYNDLTQKLTNQQAQLKNILKAIYQSNLKSEVAENLLSTKPQQNKLAKLYLAKLYERKQHSLKQIKQTSQAINRQQKLIAEQAQKITQQQTKLKNIQRQHSDYQEQYQLKLSKLQTQLKTDQRKLKELMASEKALRRQIQLANRKPVTYGKAGYKASLGSPSSQFTPPVQIQGIVHNFNSIQLGEIRWRGVVFKAPLASPVRAIQAGTVVFAGKLQGYGLMVIVKHNAQDLSIYGYNQSLLVKQGQTVARGQTIAQVGHIKGSTQSGLYFEISRKGVAQNPLKWLNR